jgi:hypothetical protein
MLRAMRLLGLLLEATCNLEGHSLWTQPLLLMLPAVAHMYTYTRARGPHTLQGRGQVVSRSWQVALPSCIGTWGRGYGTCTTHRGAWPGIGQ